MTAKPNVYEGTEPYVFISYAHKDAHRVFPIIQAMNACGVRVWYDDGIEAAEDYMDYIAEKIRSCACFMAFVSKAYLESIVSDTERKYAYKIQKKLFFIYLEEVVPSPGFVMIFDNTQALFRKDHISDQELADKIISAKVLDPCRHRPSSVQSSIAEKYYELGKTHYDAKEWDLAVSYFRISAEHGHPSAQFFMGVCLFTDNPYLKRNPTAAAKWFILAVEQGHAGAINNLAFQYMRGIGVEKDPQLAAELFRKSAALGNPAAASNLKYCLAALDEEN